MRETMSFCRMLTVTSKSKISNPVGCFIVGLQIGYYVPSTLHSPDEPEEKRTALTGYKDLFNALAPVHKTQSCEHDPTIPVNLKLGNDAIIVAGYNGHFSSSPPALQSARIWICPTIGNQSSRWYTLWWLNQQNFVKCNAMLRGRDCCVGCAFEQASSKKGMWCVVT
jgi:hypothetical protein